VSDWAVRTEGLKKRYGARTALSAVDLAVPEGSFFAILGPNGAGKTTLMRCLMGLIRPDAGAAEVLGMPLGPGYPPVELKARIGYVAQTQALPERMTARELIALCRGLNPRWDDATVRRYLDLFGLPADLPGRQMSAGMKAQLALTLAMGGRPELLVLDEPTLGLDPLSRHQYLQVLLADSLETGCTVLLSSHDLAQIERIADRVAILVDGRIVVAGAVDDLKDREKRVRVSGTVDESAVVCVTGVRRAVREPGGWLLYASGDGGRIEREVRALPGVIGVQVLDQSLEEIFISYCS